MSSRRPRRKVRAKLLTGLVCVLAGAVATAPAGVQLVDTKGNALLWDLDEQQPNVVNGRITYYIDPRGTTDTITGGKSAFQAVRDGVRAWEVATTRVRMTEDATRSASGRSTTDRVNWIGWADGMLGPATFAATFPTRIDTKILDMDVVLNEGFTWNTRTPGLADVADIEALVAHEWGHALGLDHVPLRTSTMYFSSEAGTTSMRSLSLDDEAAIGTAYPNATYSATSGALTGHVDVIGTKDDRAVLVVAIAVATSEPTGSTFTRPDGTWDIRGLPEGTYRVLAVPAVPLGDAVNAFWRTGNAAFLPSFASPAPGNPGPLSVLAVAAGKTAVAPDIEVVPKADAHEPDGTRAQAAELRVGDAIAGRIDSASDEDWVTFDLTAGTKVSISVLAWGLGADCDPTFTVFGPLQQSLAIALDVRSGPTVHFFPEGDDLDARIFAFDPPATGTYAVRVRNETQGTGTRAFYVLSVTPTTDAPNAALTRTDVRPPRIDADGASSASIVVRPLREDGADVGPGATVDIENTGPGTFGAASYAGNGEYVAPVFAPTSPGRSPFSVRVTTSAGVATVPSAGVVVYLGPVDAFNSPFVASPRRIAADGAEKMTLTFVPRDAAGEPLGAGRAVAFIPTPALSLVVGSVRDVGDGSYEADATAGTAEGVFGMEAYLGGNPTGAQIGVRLGFDLEDVLSQAESDVAMLRLTPGLPRASKKAFSSAAARIYFARQAGSSQPSKQVSKARDAAQALDTAFTKSKGLVTDPGMRVEIARALRGMAATAISGAVATTPKQQRRLSDATALFAEGDTLLAGGSPAKAAAKWAKAYATAAPLVP